MKDAHRAAAERWHVSRVHTYLKKLKAGTLPQAEFDYKMKKLMALPVFHEILTFLT